MEYIKCEKNGYIFTITIDRPSALNALNTQVLLELDEAFSNIDLASTRVILLTGAGGKAFVAGADISEMSNLSKEEAKKFSKIGNDLFRKIETFPIPVIAIIDGFTLGGGCELAMACDFRIASEKSKFGQPEVTLGITPGFGGTQRLARLIGVGKAKEIIFTGRVFEADEALRIGLIDFIFPKENFKEEVSKIVDKIVKNAPIAIREAKKCINIGIEIGMDNALKLEEDLFSNCFLSNDQKEGMKFFLEKRKDIEFKNK